MAKFADIYKQELKSKGILSSLGSAALKGQRERTDIRNTLFGGKGILSSTGQKIFGKGYSALSGGAQKLSASDSSPQQTAAMNGLTISSQRQEGLLKIVAKNTMNMNMMARDMNITRQNIASMTKKITGKSSKGADAMWMGADKRNAFFADKKTPTNTKQSSSSDGGGLGGIFSGMGNVISGGAGIVGSVVSGLLGTVGSVGGGILSMIGGILSGVPGGWLLGTIAVAGVAYLLKEVYDNLDFSKLKDDILKGLGFDPSEKERTLTQQLADKLDAKFDTKMFSKTLKDSQTLFNPIIDKLGQGIATAMDVAKVYIASSFRVLADAFSGIGKVFGFLFNEFFENNKGKIFMAMAAGLAAGTAKDPRSALAALAAVGIAGLYGAATSNDTRQSLQEKLDDETKTLRKREDELAAMSGPGRHGPTPYATKKVEEQRKIVAEIQDKLDKANKEYSNLFDVDTSKFEKYKQEEKAKLPGGEYGGGYIPMSPTTPSRLKDTIGAREGGAAGYDAIFGFSKAGGDPSIKQSTGKALSELSIGEALAIGDARMQDNKGAIGRYGFLPNTLRGALKTANLTEKDVFNAENQDKLYTAVLGQMINGLKSEGFTNITPDLLALAWHVGPKGARDLVNALEKNPNAIASDILNLSPKGKETNPTLNKSVDEVLKGMQLSSLSTKLNDGTRNLALSGVTSGSPSITVGPTTNVTQAGGGRSASAYDMEGLFVENMIYRQTGQA
jgi:hypothetical protein